MQRRRHQRYGGLCRGAGTVKVCLPLLIILTVVIAACGPAGGSPATAPPASAPDEAGTKAPPGPRPCGNGICDGPEDSTNCPVDCPEKSPTVSRPLPTAPAPLSQEPAALFLGIMVHLEGWSDGTNQARFEDHVDLMREYATLFEAYGAKLTWESKEVTEGIQRWGDNVLAEMEERGHGIGVHADIGGEGDYDCDRFAADLRVEKEQLESLGVSVRHASGIVSRCDWVAAAAEAGYPFTTGQVAYSVMSMPADQRPPEYRDCPNPRACHDTFPPDLADRIHPWRMHSGADWLAHDPNGRLVMLPSSQVLPCFAEELEGGDTRDCSFDQVDLDAFVEQLENAIALSDPSQVNTYYVAWSLGSPLDPSMIEEWLRRISPYVESGRVEWKTLPEMYDAFVAWESGS